MLAKSDPQQFLDTAMTALSTASEWRLVLDQMPVPIYVTDKQGGVTYWNSACVDLAGREPQLGKDRWCVTWKLYTTTGDFLPHDRCPMAQAIREQRVIRGAIAIAERPDGSRIAFRAYPTPRFDEHGTLIGAVNMLVDVTEEQAKALHRQAEHCRRLADATYDRKTSRVLGDMANGFDRTANELEQERS